LGSVPCLAHGQIKDWKLGKGQNCLVGRSLGLTGGRNQQTNQQTNLTTTTPNNGTGGRTGPGPDRDRARPGPGPGPGPDRTTATEHTALERKKFFSS